jgi:hypothetical protein
MVPPCREWGRTIRPSPVSCGSTRFLAARSPSSATGGRSTREEGTLGLDDRVAPFIAHLTPAPGATGDPRWEQIDRPAIAAAAVDAPAPASSETLVRYTKGMPLDFDAGEKFAYSTFR